MPEAGISAVTVCYFSEVSMLKTLIRTLSVAADQFFSQYSKPVHYFLVDNSEDDTYFEQLKKLQYDLAEDSKLRLEIIQAPSNQGYGGGNNLVIDRLNSDYHLVINPDVEVDVDTLCNAAGYLEQNHNVSLLSPMITEPCGQKHHVVKTYPNCFTLLLRYLNTPRLNRTFSHRLEAYACSHLGGEPNKSVELAGGCFQFMRTALFLKLKGFDERFFMYFEDYDLSIRAKQSGDIAYVPSVKIAHAGGGVGRKALKHHLYFGVSALRFFNKHGWRLW